MTPDQNQSFSLERLSDVKEKILMIFIGPFVRKNYYFSSFELISRDIFQISNLKIEKLVCNLQKIAKICPKPLRR